MSKLWNLIMVYAEIMKHHHHHNHRHESVIGMKIFDDDRINVGKTLSLDPYKTSHMASMKQWSKPWTPNHDMLSHSPWLSFCSIENKIYEFHLMLWHGWMQSAYSNFNMFRVRVLCSGSPIYSLGCLSDARWRTHILFLTFALQLSESNRFFLSLENRTWFFPDHFCYK